MMRIVNQTEEFLLEISLLIPLQLYSYVKISFYGVFVTAKSYKIGIWREGVIIAVFCVQNKYTHWNSFRIYNSVQLIA